MVALRLRNRDAADSLAALIRLVTEAEAGQSAFGCFAPTVIVLCDCNVTKLQERIQLVLQNPAASANQYRGKFAGLETV